MSRAIKREPKSPILCPGVKLSCPPVQNLNEPPEPYLFEAGLDPDNLYGNRKFLLDGLMVFHVIDKRHLELDDLAQGNKLSLITIIFHGFEQKVESLESGK